LPPPCQVTALPADSRRALATIAATAPEASRVITESARLVRMIGTRARYAYSFWLAPGSV